jgi:triphosphoribosyl-dephospho-CoA synthase
MRRVSAPEVLSRAFTPESLVSAAFIDACLLDMTALKPGNVGIHGSGHGMAPAQFIRSAVVSVPAIASAATTVGERIYNAIVATRAAVGMNTNLGIVLLAAPLAYAFHELSMPASEERLRVVLEQVLGRLSIADAQLAFDAIALANPGGLGDAPRHDVREPAAVSLLDAMREAADRDSIARQYATGYADIFEVGLPALRAARAGGCSERRGATRVYLAFLAALPDSHVARKLGIDTAQALRASATSHALAAGRGVETDKALREWDVALKTRGINPGTSADLTVATLFLDRLLSAHGTVRSIAAD